MVILLQQIQIQIYNLYLVVKRLIIYSPVIIMMLQVTMSIVVLKITLTLEMILIILRFMMQLEHQVTTV